MERWTDPPHLLAEDALTQKANSKHPLKVACHSDVLRKEIQDGCLVVELKSGSLSGVCHPMGHNVITGSLGPAQLKIQLE